MIPALIFAKMLAYEQRLIRVNSVAPRRPVLYFTLGLFPSSYLLFLASFVGCQGDSPPDGRIMVKNDSQDRSYNTITVSGGGAFGALKPGEELILPVGTKTFSVERRYRDYTRSYSVSCPPLSGRGILVKLIDIHVNRIAGGCKTTHASKE
jgi:hypothetical protein